MTQRGNDQNALHQHVDVLIIGAGPTGLTLACDLARRGVTFAIIDKSLQPFQGSRAKGIQPRTLEVMNDLGVVDAVLAAGAPYPRMKAHIWKLAPSWRMHRQQAATDDVPYPNIHLVPQWCTEQVLRDKLALAGSHVQYGVDVQTLEQNDTHVTVQAMHDGQWHTIIAKYAVGCDGGRSFVRKHLNIGFAGTTKEQGRMIVGDLHVTGLSREHWHVWPFAKSGAIALCPLPHTELFQLMMTLGEHETTPELNEQIIQQRWLTSTGQHRITLHTPEWLSVFRPNIRMAERYRTGRVFLAGDAAHVHTPAGAQGLNTGVQDAYNLGWKLHHVLFGAPDALLDTYGEERMPVAAAVLGLSTKLYDSFQNKSLPTLKRGDEERQLLLHYRYSTLATNVGTTNTVLQAGDRAPDAHVMQQGHACSLFALYRGPQFTLLTFGNKAAEALAQRTYRHVDRYVVTSTQSETNTGQYVLQDISGKLHKVYGVALNDNVVILVRPDGYVGLVVKTQWAEAVDAYLQCNSAPDR